MRVAPRPRVGKHPISRLNYVMHHDVVLISESEDESSALDLLGDLPDIDGLIVAVRAEIRLSEAGEHYVILMPLVVVPSD